MTIQKCALSIAFLGFLVLFSLGACSEDKVDGFVPDDGDGDGGAGGVCILNNCDLDRDCAGCTRGRHTCLQQEHRCIACQPGSTGTCKQGQYCTQYGDCVPNGSVCPKDPQGNPQISCNADTDCAACDPKHRVCDTEQHKCVGCLATNVTNCQSTDVCTNDACVPKCPAKCDADSDCDQCGAPGKEAHVCNNHKCAQCSPTKPCPNGALCDARHGVCEPKCGIVGKAPETCASDVDCAGCKGGETHCQIPVNGGNGTCTTPATGCSDLGKGVIVLPEPFSNVTNLCSNDQDCSNISANINVGKILRDITGVSAIGDGVIPYAMHACASVRLPAPNASCGVCVPCREDYDCQDIDILKVAGGTFGIVGSIAAKLLLDQVFGPNDAKVHMYCQPVADGYGACVPCADFLHACGFSGQYPNGAQCNHDQCTRGDPLGWQCSDCVAQVCKYDSSCCDPANGIWDDQCIAAVDEFCSDTTCAAVDSCFGKAPNTWFCSQLNTSDAFHCDDQTHVDQAWSCPAAGGSTANKYCRKSGTGPKDPAITGADGNPECFPSP